MGLSRRNGQNRVGECPSRLLAARGARCVSNNFICAPLCIKKGFACILAGLVLLGNPMQVFAGETYQTRYDVPPEERDDYTVVTESLGEYEVCEGDCLWRISEQLLGDGGQYPQIIRQNADVITNPDVIYPQMRLQIRMCMSQSEPAATESGRRNTALVRRTSGALAFWNRERSMRTVR